MNGRFIGSLGMAAGYARAPRRPSL